MSITINFKITSKRNPQVYCEGYVDIHDENGEDTDWYYWTGIQYQTNIYIHHDGEKITGLTTEQNDEIDIFRNDYLEDSYWIDTRILQSEEGENKKYFREHLILTINED